MSVSSPSVESPDDLLEAERRTRAERARAVARTGTLVERFGVIVPFVIVAAVGIAVVPNFLSGANISNILVTASLTAIVGFGMTLIIANRQLDLSVGSGVGLAACVTAITVGSLGAPLGIAAGLVIGAAVGFLNGFLVARLRVPSFVATLGTMGIVRGVALLMTGGGSVRIENDFLSQLATGQLVGMPTALIVAIAAFVAAHLILDRSAFGRHVCAVGGRPEAARDSGIRIDRVRVATFVVGGVFVGLAGVLYASQLGQVNGTMGTGLELQIIAITVLGGTSLAGGTGNLPGTFIAAVLLAMINSGLNLLNVQSFYQYAAVGVLLLFALSLDSVRRAVQRRALLGA